MSKKLIYVVDDDHLILKVMDEFLTSEGFGAKVTDDGYGVLVLCEKNVPDLIISDVKMPKLDGLSLLRKLKKKESTKDVPVVFISGYADQEFLEQAKELGAIYYLFKPFTNDDLRKIIAQVFADV